VGALLPPSRDSGHRAPPCRTTTTALGHRPGAQPCLGWASRSDRHAACSHAAFPSTLGPCWRSPASWLGCPSSPTRWHHVCGHLGAGCRGWVQGAWATLPGSPCLSSAGDFPAALLAQNLNSDDQDVVLRALKRVPESRLKKEGLKALSLLLVEGNSKVVSAVSAQLRSLAENPRFRQRVRARDEVGWCRGPRGAARWLRCGRWP